MAAEFARNDDERCSATDPKSGVRCARIAGHAGSHQTERHGWLSDEQRRDAAAATDTEKI